MGDFMNKLKIVIVSLFFMVPFAVDADTIYNLDIKVNIARDGSANITELWDVKADDGTEWYKTFSNLGNIEVSDFVVKMDDEELEQKDWNIKESLENKAGYFGINEIQDGFELCFGKSDMERHTFTLKYHMSNDVFNTEDSQVIYHTLIPKGTVKKFKVNILSYFNIPDTIKVSGYGYKGKVGVKDGRIILKNGSGLNNEYVVVLARFGKDTFNTNNTYEQFKAFDDVLDMAAQGAYDSVNNNENNSNNDNTNNNDISEEKKPILSQNKKEPTNNNKSYFVYIVGAEVLIIIGGIVYFVYKRMKMAKKAVD